jgi:hypothetical protein
MDRSLLCRALRSMQREMQQLTGMIRNFGEFDLEGEQQAGVFRPHSAF